MDVTGFDYVFLSQTKITGILENLKKSIFEFWSNAEIDVDEEIEGERYWVFVCRDLKMLKDETMAYELDSNGEGPFSLICDRNKYEDKLFKDIDNSELRISLKDYWSYTLVLPERIENDIFSMKIYNLVSSLIGFNNDNIQNLHNPV